MNPDSNSPIPPATPDPVDATAMQNMASDSAPNNSSNEPQAIPSLERHNWRYWLKRLLVCNPFFLCSAALLLFGVNRLSTDPEFLGDEVHNLLFNFFALQLYEVLLIITAIVLARRKVWYDSALLVVLEHGLVLVPFMLISQATMEGMGLAWTLTLAGGALAVSRSASLRRWYPQFNLPSRALALGAVILAANIALPPVFRIVMEETVDDWETPNLLAWYVVLPVLAAGANLLPRPRRYGGLNPERQWLPLFIYGLWIAGSAVHVWCVAYICKLPVAMHHFAPLACVCAWTLWNRISDCVPNPSLRWQTAMLTVTFCAPLLAFGHGWLFVWLVGIHHFAYVALWLLSNDRQPIRNLAKHFAMASLLMLLSGIPEEGGRMLLPEFNRARCIALAAALYVVAFAARSKRPELGLLGALAAVVSAGLLVRGTELHALAQTGLVFLIVHSLRWPDLEHVGARFLRCLAVLAWTADALIWTRESGLLESSVVAGAALLVGSAWGLAWWARRQRASLVVPFAAAITMVSGPGNWFLRHGSDGLFAIIGSFLLFAIGTVLAWTRGRRGQTHEPQSRP